ncbi:hypothetical protein F5146DRAFT_1000321 [Armillaria mellea]|nr:hypothetical protein F5146DRAFT_1000321 [Armillaria mellea]
MQISNLRVCRKQKGLSTRTGNNDKGNGLSAGKQKYGRNSVQKIGYQQVIDFGHKFAAIHSTRTQSRYQLPCSVLVRRKLIPMSTSQVQFRPRIFNFLQVLFSDSREHYTSLSAVFSVTARVQAVNEDICFIIFVSRNAVIFFTDVNPGSPGDNVDEVRSNPYCGVGGDINDNYPFAPPEIDHAIHEEDEANMALNDDEDIKFVKELMGNFDFEVEDSNWGIEVYCEAVITLSAIVEAHNGH